MYRIMVSGCESQGTPGLLRDFTFDQEQHPCAVRREGLLSPGTLFTFLRVTYVAIQAIFYTLIELVNFHLLNY